MTALTFTADESHENRNASSNINYSKEQFKKKSIHPEFQKYICHSLL